MSDQESVEQTVRKHPGIRDDATYPTASAFLEALGPTSERWATGQWLFRGHGDANWEVKSRGSRPGEFERFGKFGGEDPTVPIQLKQRDQQTRLLQDFASRLDLAGIVIPSASPFPSEIEKRPHNTLFPPPASFPLMALAQHHGLPTFLLDWTRRPRHAAYFAASTVIQSSVGWTGTHLAVLALDISVAHGCEFRGPLAQGLTPQSVLEQYQAPGGTNPNMRAQAGTFTVLPSLDNASVEEHIHHCVEHGVMRSSPLCRLTLPNSEAPSLMRLLALEGIDGASMYPGIDGVVKAMRERALWDAPQKGASR